MKLEVYLRVTQLRNNIALMYEDSFPGDPIRGKGIEGYMVGKNCPHFFKGFQPFFSPTKLETHSICTTLREPFIDYHMAWVLE